MVSFNFQTSTSNLTKKRKLSKEKWTLPASRHSFWIASRTFFHFNGCLISLLQAQWDFEEKFRIDWIPYQSPFFPPDKTIQAVAKFTFSPEFNSNRLLLKMQNCFSAIFSSHVYRKKSARRYNGFCLLRPWNQRNSKNLHSQLKVVGILEGHGVLKRKKSWSHRFETKYAQKHIFWENGWLSGKFVEFLYILYGPFCTIYISG